MDEGTVEMYRLETMGVELVGAMAARAGVRGAGHASGAVGPDFDYARSPRLFGGRVGRGPLRVVLDTNILIDYFEHGRRMWEGRPMSDGADADYGEHLEALQLILSVWVLRDVELVMLKESLTDSKKKRLSVDRQKRNRNAWVEFYRALTHGPSPAATNGGTVSLPESVVDRVLEGVPAGGDRRLVRAALADGAHIYLTRDAGVVAAAPRLRGFGLSVMSPGDLLEALSAYGALDFLWDPASLDWSLPDQEKVAHLIWALPRTV